MKRFLAAVFLAIPLFVTAQQPPPDQRADDPDYRRPSDGIPPFDVRYFAGRWTFEWDIPDSVFGEGGELTGTETIACASPRACASTLAAEGPAGRYTVRATIAYDEATHTLTRTEDDSRGFQVKYRGQLSSDQGFHQITWTGEPFKLKGRTVQIKSSAAMTAPSAYRMRWQVAVDGGEFENLGSPWWRKTQ